MSNNTREYHEQEADMLIRQGFLSPVSRESWINERIAIESVDETKKSKKKAK